MIFRQFSYNFVYILIVILMVILLVVVILSSTISTSTGCFSLIIPERLRGNDWFWDHFEAVRSFDGLNLDEKYTANPFLTLPRPRDGFKSWFKTDFWPMLDPRFSRIPAWLIRYTEYYSAFLNFGRDKFANICSCSSALRCRTFSWPWAWSWPWPWPWPKYSQICRDQN